MKKIVIVAVVALLLGVTGEARAQDWFWGGAYSMSLPTGDTKAFNEGYSFRGVTIEGRKILNDNVSFGLSFGWQVMNDIKTNETIELSSGALTGTFYTYTNSFPIFINAHYYLGKPASVRPFVGLNAGGMIIERRAGSARDRRGVPARVVRPWTRKRQVSLRLRGRWGASAVVRDVQRGSGIELAPSDKR
jgi:hypothetical protein